MIIAGIDEAGLGPILGPLVVTATAMSVGDDQADTSLWELLSPAVSRKKRRRGSAVAIADSKKLYSRGSKAGLGPLERAVLGMLATAGRRPKTFGELLSVVSPGLDGELGRYPWYADETLAIGRDTSDMQVAFAGNSLGAAMAGAGVSLMAIRSEAILVGQFNRLVGNTRNKSTAALDVTCRLLIYLWEKACSDKARWMRIWVDRQGGRKHYLPALERIFPGCGYKILVESDTLSSYRITAPDRGAEVHFATRGEEAQLPIALASMTSKYIRELFMVMLNRFWQGHVSDLRPTAGYYVDGKRFLEQIEPKMNELGIDREIVLRCR